MLRSQVLNTWNNLKVLFQADQTYYQDRISKFSRENRALVKRIDKDKAWLKSLEALANQPIIQHDIYGESSLSKAWREAKEWENRYYSLRNKINFIPLDNDSSDDEFGSKGPQIEEVD